MLIGSVTLIWGISFMKGPVQFDTNISVDRLIYDTSLTELSRINLKILTLDIVRSNNLCTRSDTRADITNSDMALKSTPCKILAAYYICWLETEFGLN